MLALLLTAVALAVPPGEVARGRALSSSAVALTNSLRLAEAETAAGTALQIANECEDPVGKARALDALGIVARSRGETAAALGFTEEALAVAESAGDDDALARVENDLGRIAFDLQIDFVWARIWYERGLARRPRLHDSTIVARLLNNLGTVYLALNDRAGAVGMYRQALLVAEHAHDQLGVLTAEHNIGLAYTQQQSPALALVHLQRALAIEQTLHDRSAIARTMLSISESHRSLGHASSALDALAKARKAAIRAGDELILATILLREADLRLQRGEIIAADAAVTKALGLMTRMNDVAALPQAEIYRARIRLQQHRVREASLIARDAALAADRLGQDAVEAEARTISGIALRRAGDIEGARKAFELAIALIEDQRLTVVGPAEVRQRSFEGQLSPYQELMEISSPRRALELSEKARSRVLLDVLRAGRDDLTSFLTAEERATQRRMLQAIARDERAMAPSSLARDRDELAAFQTDMYAAHPELRLRSGFPTPSNPTPPATLLRRDGDAIVEYALTADHLLIFVITRHGMQRVTVPATRARVRQVAARFASDLSDRNLGFRRSGRELYELLIAPIERSLAGVQRVCLIPDDELWRVPFQALLDPHDHYLLERYALFYAPSIEVLREMTRIKRGSPLDSVLAVSNSSVIGSDAEVRALASIYGLPHTTVLENPSEKTVIQAVTDYRVIHFATHGFLDDASPLDSHLEFRSNGDADGSLEAREVMGLHLRAQLVVLSACEMAAGRPAPGEGMIGMSWAFFVAGCPSLVAGQWKVESTSTAILMVTFHRQLVEHHQSIAEALRSAQLQLLRQSRYEHPHYWAPFIALGDGW